MLTNNIDRANYVCYLSIIAVSSFFFFSPVAVLASVRGAAAKSLQLCLTLCNPIDGSPPGSPSLGFSRQEHWSGLHFLLQCRKVKSESEVAQSCPTLSDPMDCSPPGSSVHGVFQARVLEWGATAFSERCTKISCNYNLRISPYDCVQFCLGLYHFI